MSDELSELDRQTAQRDLERAVGSGRLTLGEFAERIEQVFAATTHGQVDRLMADLPTPVVGQRRPTGFLLGLFGDVVRRGRWSLGERLRAVTMFSDVHLDLRDAVVSGNEADITVFHMFGDVNLVVPEGIEVELTGFAIFGDRELSRAPGPRLQGAPVLHIRVIGLFGDVTVRSQSR